MHQESLPGSAPPVLAVGGSGAGGQGGLDSCGHTMGPHLPELGLATTFRCPSSVGPSHGAQTHADEGEAGTPVVGDPAGMALGPPPPNNISLSLGARAGCQEDRQMLVPRGSAP